MIEPTALTRDVLARAGRPIPRFGSPEWDALPEQDLRRVAAVLIAAEAWRDHCSPDRVAEDLEDQLDADDLLVRDRLDHARAAIHDGLPRIGEEPWWTRVIEAEKAARADARAHFDAWTAKQAGR